MVAEQRSTIQIFYCYAHKDEAFRNELEKHLSALKRQGLVSGWYDRDIQAGEEWKREIDIHLNTADIILLLVSPDFLSSDYCYSVELQRALERHRAGEAHVIPIILRPIDWEGTPISELQVLPAGGKPVSLWPKRDKALWDVARGIRAVASVHLSRKVNEEWGGSLSLGVQHARTDIADQLVTQTSYEMINAKEAISLFQKLMQPNSPVRILCIVGEGKLGKSHLLTKVFPALARQDYEARCVVLDLRNQVHTVPDILYTASSQLGNQVCDGYLAAYETWIRCPTFTRDNIQDVHFRNQYLTSHFVKALGQLDEKPLLLLIDSVDCASKAMQTWLMHILLIQASSLNHVRVVLAGRSLSEADSSYATLCQTYQLLPVTDEAAYIDYCRHLNAKLVEQSIRDFAYACDYKPGIFADLVLPRFVSRR